LKEYTKVVPGLFLSALFKDCCFSRSSAYPNLPFLTFPNLVPLLFSGCLPSLVLTYFRGEFLLPPPHPPIGNGQPDPGPNIFDFFYPCRRMYLYQDFFFPSIPGVYPRSTILFSAEGSFSTPTFFPPLRSPSNPYMHSPVIGSGI